MQINAFMKLLTNYSEQTIGLGRLKINGLYKCERMMWKVKQYVRFFNNDVVLINTGLTPFEYLAQIFLFHLLFGSQ